MLVVDRLNLEEFPYKQDIFTYLVKGQEGLLNSRYDPDLKLEFICPSCGITHSKSLRTILKGKGAYCRDCSRVLVVDDYRQLKENYPEVSDMLEAGDNREEYSGRKITGRNVTYGSNIKYKFKCRNGHIYTQEVSTVVKSYREGSRYLSCPYCAGTDTKYIKRISDVVKNAVDWWDKEKNGRDVNEVPYQKYSHYNYFWICPKGHSFTRSLSKIKDNILTCPICSGYKFESGVNDIATLVPNLVKYFDEDKNGIKASEAYWSKYCEKKYWWVCEKGHSFNRAPVNINPNNFTCAVCQGKQINEGVNDLQTLRPDIMKYWSKDNDINPWEVTVDSGEIASFHCVQCGCIYDTSITSRTRSRGLCPDCSINYSSSLGEKEVGEFLLKLGIEVEEQATIFKNKSKACDFYIPSKNLVIEYNGLFWHSEASGKDKNYHYNRYKELKDKNIQTYYIWEDDWVKNKELVKRMLMRKLGVSNEVKANARDCEVYEETTDNMDEIRVFLEENHIQGYKSGSLYLSLRDCNMNLLALMVLQNKKNNVYEIVRYASSCILRGGFTKILSVLKQDYNIQEVQTFSDNSVSEGKLYENSGFILDSELSPDYCYVYRDERIHKFNFRKEMFEKKGLLYDESLSESKLASLNGISRIWDIGKKKWIKRL